MQKGFVLILLIFSLAAASVQSRADSVALPEYVVIKGAPVYPAPVRYKYSAGLTLMNVITTAGGLPFGNYKFCYLIRSGKKTRFEFSALEGNHDIALKPGDVIDIPAPGDPK